MLAAGVFTLHSLLNHPGTWFLEIYVKNGSSLAACDFTASLLT
jgi:hypothetical protein